MEKTQILKTTQQIVLDACLWDSGKWDGWEMVLDSSPQIIGPYGLSKLGQHYFSGYFSIYLLWRAGVQEKSMISPLLQTINSGTIVSETTSKS